MPDHRNIIDYSKARYSIQSGDVGLCRRKSLISLYGRSEYSHAWMFAWWGTVLMVVELREWIGGRAITASAAVRERPSGSVDVYRPKYSSWDASIGAVEQMKRKAGNHYNYRGILLACAFRLPGLNRIWRPDLKDADVNGRKFYPEFCSAAVSDAIREGAKLDLVPNLSDADTEPADLGRSAALEYLLTIAV